MTIVAVPTGDTGHRFTRGGRDIRVRVQEVAGGAGDGHVLVFGEPADNCLVRVHSRCLYGEALGSQDCDCGPELAKALDRIQDEGAGVLVYLEQEGRGCGLVAKAHGYRESERSGADTFTSYERLGLPADARTYTHAATSLLGLGLSRVRLLTNNPDKVAALTAAGIAVTAVPLATTPSATGRRSIWRPNASGAGTGSPPTLPPGSRRRRCWIGPNPSRTAGTSVATGRSGMLPCARAGSWGGFVTQVTNVRFPATMSEPRHSVPRSRCARTDRRAAGRGPPRRSVHAATSGNGT